MGHGRVARVQCRGHPTWRQVRPHSQVADGGSDSRGNAGDEGSEKLEERRVDQRRTQAKKGMVTVGQHLGFNMLAPHEGLGRVGV